MSPFTVLIILALIIMGIGGVLFWLNSRLKHFFKIKITYWLLLLYALVLLAASASVPFVSKEFIKLDAQEQLDKEKTFDELREDLKSGQSEKIDEKYILAEEHFEGFENQTLKITANLENWSYIYVERKDVNDGKIKLVTYQPLLMIDGADFSELLKSYEIKLKDDTLSIRSSQQDLHLSIMHSPFPVRMLTNVSMLEHHSNHGEQLIYLTIPRDLQLQADESLYLMDVE